MEENVTWKHYMQSTWILYIMMKQKYKMESQQHWIVIQGHWYILHVQPNLAIPQLDALSARGEKWTSCETNPFTSLSKFSTDVQCHFQSSY